MHNAEYILTIDMGLFMERKLLGIWRLFLDIIGCFRELSGCLRTLDNLTLLLDIKRLFPDT